MQVQAKCKVGDKLVPQRWLSETDCHPYHCCHLEGSYGGLKTQREKSSSFYLPPRASSTPLSVGYRDRISGEKLRGTRVHHNSSANAASLPYHKSITFQIDVLFAFNSASITYQKPPVDLLPAHPVKP